MSRNRRALRDTMLRQIGGTVARRLTSSLRKDSRGQLCQVIWLMPVHGDGGRPEFSSAIPVLTKDMSPSGLSVLFNGWIPWQEIVAFLPYADSWIECELRHTTPLGYGYFQMGLCPRGVIEADTAWADALQQRRDAYRTVLPKPLFVDDGLSLAASVEEAARNQDRVAPTV